MWCMKAQPHRIQWGKTTRTVGTAVKGSLWVQSRGIMVLGMQGRAVALPSGLSPPVEDHRMKMNSANPIWNPWKMQRDFFGKFSASKDDAKNDKASSGKEEAKGKEEKNGKKGEKEDGKKGNGKKKKPQSDDEGTMPWKEAMLLLALAAVVAMLTNNRHSTSGKIDWNTFKTTLLQEGKVRNLVVIKNKNKVLVFTDDSTTPSHTFTIADVDTFDRKLEETQRELDIPVVDFVPVKYETDWLVAASPILASLALVGSIIGVGAYALMSRGAGGSSDIFSVLKSKAKRVDKKTGVKTTFKDVAGLEEAKIEIMEFVDFLKNPQKYKSLGAKIPKGALLVGPPGTGKTLLAKATAGEAGVPFFTISGSDFIEMFVGVGPSRVRDLFDDARESAPCIIFIDELDAVGRARSTTGFHNDERENTLNQLLVEMDGFNTEAGVVVLAGTNRADILDSALLRPGRFDRQIYVDLPDLHGRKAILLVHLKPLKVTEDLDAIAERLATLTPGFSGADLANVCNEGALIAARYNKTHVELKDLEAAIERVVGGMERQNRIMSPKEKKTVAYHEAGHATVGWFLKHVDPLLKVSIVPRGVSTLGYAMYQPRDQYLYSREELMDRMCMALGGRISEAITFGRITTGARDDLERVTQMAYAQVARYGMNKEIGTVSFSSDKKESYSEKPFSEATGKKIDAEVRKLVADAYRITEELLREKKEGLEKVAQRLLEREVLQREDLQELLGIRPFDEKVTFDQLTNQDVKPQPEATA